MNYYKQGDAANADKIKAAFERKGFIPRIAPMYYGSESVLFFTGTDNYIYETSSQWVMDIIKTHPDYQELELPVEPKFKKGDWIAYNENKSSITPMQIIRITEDKYIVSGHWSYDFRTLEADWHLWTIQDAKDGDVLRLGCVIAMFKKYIGQEECICYCSISEDGDFEIPIENGEDNIYGCTNTTPATKEQRDLLFKKMKEAGYQWDADKKELRKIQPHYDISNFKPFDKVLVRDGDLGLWKCDIFSDYYDNFYCFRGTWEQCIPFEGNEHLLGTTDMCDEQYINW